MQINISNDNEYVSHLIYTNYEASRNGIVRHRRRKIPIGVISNMGYLRIAVCQGQQRKKYYTHRLIAEIFIGSIPAGFEIDHVNRDKFDNRVDNLRIVAWRENSLNKNPQQNQNNIPRPVLAFYDSGNFIEVSTMDFPSINSATKYFDINTAFVKRVADDIISTTYSK